jgi:hypothetical protein
MSRRAEPLRSGRRCRDPERARTKVGAIDADLIASPPDSRDVGDQDGDHAIAENGVRETP